MLIHHMILTLSLMFFSDYDDNLPIVEQHIDTISAVHIKDGAELIFFFDFVQNEWSVLDYRWLTTDMMVNYSKDYKFILYWYDSGDSCYRIMVSDHYYETWEEESPLTIKHNKPWFARLLTCGLKKPPEKKEK